MELPWRLPKPRLKKFLEIKLGFKYPGPIAVLVHRVAVVRPAFLKNVGFQAHVIEGGLTDYGKGFPKLLFGINGPFQFVLFGIVIAPLNRFGLRRLVLPNMLGIGIRIIPFIPL
jgi:hypothetical protein